MLDVVFAQIDALLSFLPLWGRVSVLGLVLGWITMAFYGWLAPQDEISRVKDEAATLRRQMRSYRGDDFQVIMDKTRESLALTLQQLRLMLVPTLIAAGPVIAALGWMELAYTYELPKPGESVSVRVKAEQADPFDAGRLEWRPDTAVEATKRGFEMTWPPTGRADTLQLNVTATGRTLLELPINEPRRKITKRSWHHWIFRNPAGYLSNDSPIQSVVFDLPYRRVLPFESPWVATWHFLFLVMLSISAGAAKFILDID